jgi:hypothetical protein
MVLVIIMVAMMFQPFWVFPEKEVETSLVDYLWFTTKHPGMEKLIKEWTGIKKIQEVMNSYIIGLFFGFVVGCLAVIFTILKSKILIGPILGFVASGWMIWGLTSQIGFKYGNYKPILAMSIVVFAACIGDIVMQIVVKMVQNYKKNAKYREFNKAQAQA